jgi:hypothetical protein
MEDHPRERIPTLMRVLQILRDQIWQFVSALVGALAILTAYHVFILQQEVKALQVVILASTSLVEVEQSVAEEIEVLYKDQTVTNLSLFQVKVENSGNQPIREEDYAKPIQFVFPPHAEIVEAVILESSPPSIGMTVQTERNSATLSPVLLNQEDRTIARFLVSNMPSSGGPQPFTVDARVVGVKDIKVVSAIEEREPEKDASITLAWLLGGGAGFGLGFVAAGVVGFLAQQRLLARDQMGAYKRSSEVVKDRPAERLSCVLWSVVMVSGLSFFVWLTFRLLLAL